MSNLGKKMRRPLNSADSGTEEGDDETEEDDADEQPSASKRMKSIGKIYFSFFSHFDFSRKTKNFKPFFAKNEKKKLTMNNRVHQKE